MSMPQQFLDVSQVGSQFKQVGSKGVAEGKETDQFALIVEGIGFLILL